MDSAAATSSSASSTGFFAWIRSFGLWSKVLTFRFFKGVIDGIMFTPIIELLFMGLRAVFKKKTGAK
jgi:hypothetical protein